MAQIAFIGIILIIAGLVLWEWRTRRRRAQRRLRRRERSQVEQAAWDARQQEDGSHS